MGSGGVVVAARVYWTGLLLLFLLCYGSSSVWIYYSIAEVFGVYIVVDVHVGGSGRDKMLRHPY